MFDPSTSAEPDEVCVCEREKDDVSMSLVKLLVLKELCVLFLFLQTDPMA